MMKRICKEKRKHRSAFKLASFLIQRDLSWMQSGGREDPGKISLWEGHLFLAQRSAHFTPPGERSKTYDREEAVPPTPTEGTNSYYPTGGGNEGRIDGRETPLLLATSTGIVEIVEEILRVYPQAIENVSSEGQNILHVAIKHRQLDIFRLVKKMDVPMATLVRSIDSNGNTILHQVGHKPDYAGGRTQPGPAFQLQEELHWLERVRKIIPRHYQMHRNNAGKKSETADELFKKTHEELLREAQDWLLRSSESCTTVSVLIATVAFAAAYTVPGGSNQDTGNPILLHDPFFLIFTAMDVLSLGSSLISVVMFLSILTSPFKLQEFRHSLPRKLTLALTLLFFSVAVTMLAFAATIVLIIHSKKRWTTTLLYTAGFLPVTIFAILQFPWFLASRSTLKFFLKLIRKVLPRCFLPRQFHYKTH